MTHSPRLPVSEPRCSNTPVCLYFSGRTIKKNPHLFLSRLQFRLLSHITFSRCSDRSFHLAFLIFRGCGAPLNINLYILVTTSMNPLNDALNHSEPSNITTNHNSGALSSLFQDVLTQLSLVSGLALLPGQVQDMKNTRGA